MIIDWLLFLIFTYLIIVFTITTDLYSDITTVPTSCDIKLSIPANQICISPDIYSTGLVFQRRVPDTQEPGAGGGAGQCYIGTWEHGEH